MPKQSFMITMNSEALRSSILKRQPIATLEHSLGVSRQAINSWLSKSKIPPRQLSAIARELAFEPDEIRSITTLPRNRSFILFRSNRNVAVDNEVKNDVLEIADDFFNLSSITDLDKSPKIVYSKSDSPEKMAELILQQLKLSNEQVSVSSVVAALKSMGIFVLFYDFGEKFINAKAQAVCVQRVDKSLIFINSFEKIEDVLWRIFHETCHLFSGHTETDIGDEKFCNDTASQILTPNSFFISNKKNLKALLQKDISASPFIVEELSNKLSSSFIGVLLALKNNRIIELATQRYLWKVANNRPHVRVSDIIYPRESDNTVDFWINALEDTNRSSFYQFQHLIRMGLILEKLSIRRAAELLKINELDAQKLATKWTAQYEKKNNL